MSSHIASLRSIGCLVLVLAGSVAVALGVFLVFTSITSALIEGWGGHASGFSLLVYGLLLSLPGAFAVRRGVRIYRVHTRASRE